MTAMAKSMKMAGAILTAMEYWMMMEIVSVWLYNIKIQMVTASIVDLVTTVLTKITLNSSLLI